MVQQTQWSVRPGTRFEQPTLKRMIYEALYWQPDAEREPFDFVIAHDEISRYVDGWGRRGDSAMVAVVAPDERPVGAAWYRLFPEDQPGYGFVEPSIPELAIAVENDFRGQGVGRALLESLIRCACQSGMAHLSLSVEVANVTALTLYQRLGFVPIGGDEHNHTMLLCLESE